MGLAWVRRDGVGGCGGRVGCGGGAVGAFRVDCAGAGACCGAVLYGIYFRDCVGAVFGLACVAARVVGLRLLPCGCLRLDGFRDGCHGHRRADHGRTRSRRTGSKGGRFIAEPLGEQPIGSEGSSRPALRTYFCCGLFYRNPSQHQRTFWGMLGEAREGVVGCPVTFVDRVGLTMTPHECSLL